MAADERVMGDLHTAVAQVLTLALQGTPVEGYTDPETGEEVAGSIIPPSAAIIAVATKFLKDNNITCVASKDNALGELEEQMRKRQERRNAMKASRDDLVSATEQQSFMQGLH